MEERLKGLYKEALEKIKGVKSSQELEAIRIEFLGRKRGRITEILKSIGKLSPPERPLIGKLANEIKNSIEAEWRKKLGELKEKGEEKFLDITLPGKRAPLGKLHPLTQTLEEIKDCFKSLGFEVVEGPEIETEYYNFEALNIPPYHPARDEQDSFYLKEGLLLRTQTSPVQIRIMEKRKPPLRVIAPGKCYRRDPVDASHFPMFHQVEGLAVDKKVSFSDLKGVLSYFASRMFGKGTKIRFRPSFFPFTEPSAEVDVSCMMCQGKGCSVCGRKGWLEILGAGMVHPQVLRRVNYDPEIFQGFAFGMGVERICMLRYGINDIRLFFQNDLRFLKQF